MKELSIEEKAKRYDEKLDVARHIYADPSIKDEDKYYIEVIFPELAESEDERMKEAIIATIHLYYGEPLEDEAKEMIAWLEKQGAKVSAIEGFETEFERQVSGLIASAINKEHKYNQGYVKWTANALLNYAKRELEKTGEQKPTDEEMKALLRTEYEKGRADAITEFQKEWSEEDETMIALLHNIIGHHYSMDIIKKEEQLKLEDWLKSLKDRVQPKQEWSKEDESHIRYLIECLEHCKKGVSLTMTTSTAQEYINWLKSLRPQNTWKPSDEQMEYLSKAILTLGNEGDCKTASILNELRTDLKKLREE